MNLNTLILIALALAVCGTAKRCPPGNYIAKSGDCLPCPRGTHQPRANKNACIPCPSNEVAAVEGSTKCTKCTNENTEPSAFKHECICVEGSLKTTTGECRKCESGTFFYSDNGFRQCLVCPPGYFQPDYGQLECLECPSGSLSGFGATECITCEDDEDFSEKESACVKCKAGHFHDKFTGCNPCFANTYKPKAGSGACIPCPIGTHSKQGARKCTRCPRGTAPMKKGICGSCAAGERYAPYSRSCVKCRINQFTPYRNVRLSCYTCSDMEFALEGSTKCVRCPRHKFLMKNGKCRSCPTGSVFARDILECRKCAANQFTRGDKDFCQSCPTGTYSFPESTTCFTCGKDKALILKKKKCAKCPPGQTYNSIVAKCNSCFEGSVKKTAGIQECATCPAGMTSNANHTKCVPTK